MTKDDAKEAILAEWLAVPPEDRPADAAVQLFAMEAAGRFRFRSKDRVAEIEAWIAEQASKR